MAAVDYQWRNYHLVSFKAAMAEQQNMVERCQKSGTEVAEDDTAVAGYGCRDCLLLFLLPHFWFHLFIDVATIFYCFFLLYNFRFYFIFASD
jgi:hypothetical protein